MLFYYQFIQSMLIKLFLVKKIEFRKVLTRKYQPKKIFIYSTAPISKIIAEAEIEEILIDTPENIWQKTKIHFGVEFKFFLEPV